MLPSSSVQSVLQHEWKLMDSGIHSLRAVGKNPQTKQKNLHKKNKTHLYKLSPVCTKSDIICLSPVKMLMFRSFRYFPHEPVRSSPLPEVQFLWTQWRAGPGDPKR